MERSGWTNFIVLSTVFALAIQLVVTNSVMAQAPNTTMAQDNKPIRIVDSNNNTIAIIDPKTHQTVNVTGNTTLGEFLTPEKTVTGNTTLGEFLTPEKTTINQTLTKSGNTTTNVNLTDKFDTLQGK